MTTQPTDQKTPKAKILYIEDNPLNAKLVQRVLGAEGFRVVIASNGLSGIDAAKATQPDLILMDINLPDLSGREVTTRLRALEDFKQIPIVALTAQTDKRQRAMTIAAGVDGYITKPFDVEDLVQRVSFHLTGGKESFADVDVGEAQKMYSQEVVSHLERKLREVQKANEELKRIDRIKDDFIQRVAHELRTPLTIIYGYGRLIQSADPIKQVRLDDPEFAAYVDGLVESIERMHATVNEILTIYRIATGEVRPSFGPTNLRTILTRTIASFEQAIQQRGINMVYQAEQWPANIQLDSDLLKLVMQNLVGNAIKYTPDGGTVTLKGRINKEKRTFDFSVADTGIGISKEDQERIFDQFYSVTSTDLHSTSKTAFQGGGLGLGLSITKSIVEAHDGIITVESEGQDAETLPGSTFYISLPLRESYQEIVDANASAEVAASQPEGPTPMRRVEWTRPPTTDSTPPAASPQAQSAAPAQAHKPADDIAGKPAQATSSDTSAAAPEDASAETAQASTKPAKPSEEAASGAEASDTASTPQTEEDDKPLPESSPRSTDDSA